MAFIGNGTSLTGEGCYSSPGRGLHLWVLNGAPARIGVVQNDDLLWYCQWCRIFDYSKVGDHYGDA
jgi:hypothetical protein